MVTIWLFDKTSFTSTVAYDPAKDVGTSNHKQIANASTDPKGMWLLVRARVIDDLEAVEKTLRKVKGDDTFSVHVTTESWADYSYRALISRDDWKLYLCSLVDDIDYGSHFKEVVKENASHSAARYSAMMKVWGNMADLQPYVPYGSYGTSTYSSHTLTTAKPFVPSTMWINVNDVKTMLTEAGVKAWANDPIEAMDDAAFELYLAASKHAALNGAGEFPLTAAEVDDLIDSLNDDTVKAEVVDSEISLDK